MRAVLLALPFAVLLPLAGCRDAPSPARGETPEHASHVGPDSGRRVDQTRAARALDDSLYTAAQTCCTFSPAPPALDAETLAGYHAAHFYTDYEIPRKAACARPVAVPFVRVNAPGVDDTAFQVMPPDSLMAVEVVRYDDGRTAALAHAGCESYVGHLRFTAPGGAFADDAQRRAFLAEQLRAFAAATAGLPLPLVPLADALGRGPLPGGALDELTQVEEGPSGTLEGGHRYADLTVRVGPL